jgi:hypothetical protein
MRLMLSRLVPAVVVACCLLPAAPALATSSEKQIKTSISKGVSYMRSMQEPDGSFPGFGGEWVLSALAAAKVAPANVKAMGSSRNARIWYRELIGNAATWPEQSEPSVQEFEDASLAAYAAGIDPARVSKTQNLIAQIASNYQTASPGYYGAPAEFSGTVFGLLALADARTRTGRQRVPQVLLEKSIEVLRKNQHTDGGWTYEQAEGNEAALKSPSEPDETGAAMAALCAAGVPNTDAAVLDAKGYLEADLQAEASGSGAFATAFGPNTDSNAWAVQGLTGCGFDPRGPEFTTSAGKTPIDFLISQQLPGGGFTYEPAEAAANLYSSQDAVRAIAGSSFTATPIKPSGAPKWLFDKTFSASATAPSLLTLIINKGGSHLDVCEVKTAPGGRKTTLGSVLAAAESASTPANCVTEVSPAAGKGAITSINGVSSATEPSWELSIDGGTETPALRGAPIEVGDTIYLRSTAATPVPPGGQAPTEVNVTIEGKTETLFEGPILTEGHEIKASSDTTERSCDGINVNDPENVNPGATPTAASVDAMSMIGETFDGRWYGGYDDYFITRWATDKEEGGQSWGIVVNNVFTNVGGCQYELSNGDEALWAYNAFGSKPILALYPVGDTSGSRPLTATAELGKPFEVEVVNYTAHGEGVPPASPERTGSAPYAGADVSPVQTSYNGFEKVETASPATVITNAQGTASITFTEPGWHRIKATHLGEGGKENVIRSNRLDVCVPATGETSCGAPPAEDELRTPEYLEG